MNINNKKDFIEKANNTLINIINDVDNAANLDVTGITTENTILVNVDIVNGFCKCGVFYSPRVEDNLKSAIKINEQFKEFKKIFFIDAHTKESLEFRTYPEHCVVETEEVELINELKSYIDDKAVLCHKNSTNGFVSPEFTQWLKENPQIKNFIVIGYVTDICVLQFCLSLKSYMNQWNIDGRVVVGKNSVETYDLDINNHHGDLMNLFALYNMKLNGIELVNI